MSDPHLLLVDDDLEAITPARVSIRALQELACPVATPPWPEAPGCLKGAVYRALKEKRRAGAPVPLEASLDDHAERIAHLMKHGWDDPIEIELGVPGLPGWQPTWPITDGNHRLAAAILAGRTHILASIGGCITTAESLIDL